MCPVKSSASFVCALAYKFVIEVFVCLLHGVKSQSLVEEMIFYLAKQILDVCSCYEVSSMCTLPMFYIGT